MKDNLEAKQEALKRKGAGMEIRRKHVLSGKNLEDRRRRGGKTIDILRDTSKN